MSNNLNKVFLTGHLGNDIKIHHFENGGCVGNLSLATNETYKKKDTGETITNTDWHNLVFRNKTAEIIEKYTSKGDKITIVGKLKNRKYDQDGQSRYVTEVHVLEFEFLSTKKSNETPVSDPQHIKPPPQDDGLNDDLPF